MRKLQVPAKLEAHIRNTFQKLVDDPNIPENYGIDVDTQVSEVCHEWYDGFIPHTNGGFDLKLPTDLGSAWGTGSFPSNEKISSDLERIVDDDIQLAVEQFVDDKREELSEFFTDEQLESPLEHVHYSSLYDLDQGLLAEELSQEYEYMYLTEGSTFWYQFCVLYFAADNARNESGVDELYFMAGVNMDFEYGRDRGLETTYEHNVVLEGLTIGNIDIIVKEMVASI